MEGALDAYLSTAVAGGNPLAPDTPLRTGSTLTASEAVSLWEDQVTSRACDIEARRLKLDGRSFYTISSAGHEQNAVVGALTRPTDPAFLHYRSGGFMMARSRQVPGGDRVLDTMLSICASRDDPIAQGRHKVWGSRALWVPPQTSTIASHLPKAVGMAFALGRRGRLARASHGASGSQAGAGTGEGMGLPDDALVICSFGDASANHASALSGFGAARYAVRRGNPLPILFVCEDNGIGISVDTPRRWIEDTFGTMRYLEYMEADGELDEVWDVVEEAVRDCRDRARPVFLRLVTERLWGHAGSDIETAYRTPEEIRGVEARDPLLRNTRRLVETRAATPAHLRDILQRVREAVRAASEEAAGRAHLESVEEVVAPLAPFDEGRVRAAARARIDPEVRRAHWGSTLPEEVTTPVRRTLAAHLSSALHDELLRRPEILVFGEDVGRKGGVYYVTAGLQERFGTARVFDTLLDETTILGAAQGAALAGFLPVPEIQYLAYVHNAIDQLRGEAASLQFFSSGQFRNPMVVRMAAFGYQKGFGGHFHNDNSIGALRDIPGLILAAPSWGDDAVRMLRGCIATAAECGRVVVFLEPIALYHERDLYEEGDGLWLSDYPPPGEALIPGEVALYGEGEVLLVSYANGLRMSLQARKVLEREHGVSAQVLDVRWLSPLPLEAIAQASEGKRAVIVVDECRRTGGGIAEAVVADLAERGVSARLGSVRSVDTYVPLGPPAKLVMVQTPQIVEAVVAALAGGPQGPEGTGNPPA